MINKKWHVNVVWIGYEYRDDLKYEFSNFVLKKVSPKTYNLNKITELVKEMN